MLQEDDINASYLSFFFLGILSSFKDKYKMEVVDCTVLCLYYELFQLL